MKQKIRSVEKLAFSMIQNIFCMVFEGKTELMVFRFPPLRVAI